MINSLNKLSDTETKILALIRGLELFDAVEIKYSKQGELVWTLTKKQRGTYIINLHPRDNVV
jgi:hypothetical protein